MELSTSYSSPKELKTGYGRKQVPESVFPSGNAQPLLPLASGQQSVIKVLIVQKPPGGLQGAQVVSVATTPTV
jgi:hypothetical protein